ncbi:MAG: hypothetical protein J6T92_06900, partial [Ottowia sp.]|nr:hypothetical protein [Ottowia sp.]
PALGQDFPMMFKRCPAFALTDGTESAQAARTQARATAAAAGEESAPDAQTEHETATNARKVKDEQI